MKVRLKMMIQDPRFAPQGGKRRIEGFDVSNEEFSDGPATERVAILDLDANTGQPLAGARYVPPKPGRKLGKFALPKDDEIDIESRAFNQVSVMATVLKTISLYEDADVLGRPVRWSFGDLPLQVVPRLGVKENAYYNRQLRRLEFYFFPSRTNPAETVYTSLSRDIVGHETGHAILDGIAPHLLDTRTFESLALHEAIGDLTALLIAIASPGLRLDVLAKTKGSIDDATSFSAIAEQFGMARGSAALRNLRNTKKMSDVVDHSKPHALSEVLTGALYSVLLKMHKKRWDAYTQQTDNAATRYSNSGKALWDSAQQFKRMVLRALDYLPPGSIAFADYARAIIATDQISHPSGTEERAWLTEEFVTRGIVAAAEDLVVSTPIGAWDDIDLDALLSDDAVAHAFVDQQRQLLRIPDGSPFTVQPRLKVTKKYYHRGEAVGEQRQELVTECLLKVARPHSQNSAITVGTTLAIDWATGQPRVLLTSDHSDNPVEDQKQQAMHSSALDPQEALVCCR